MFPSFPKIFLLFGTIFGLIMVFLVPPFQSPDEMAHLERSFELSEGKLISANNCVHNLPQNLQTFFENSSFFDVRDKNKDFNFQKTFAKNSTLKINQERTDFVGSSCPYPPFPYLSQIVAVLLGKILHFNLSLIFYLGRILNLFVYLALIYFALKITPGFKKTLALIALAPIALQGATAWSADGFVIGMSFLFIAYVFNLAYNKNILQINKRNIALTILLGILLSLSKLAYFPIIFLYFLIPQEKFKNKKKYFLVFLEIFFSVAIALSVWLYATKNIQVSILAPKEAFHAQLLYVLSHPFIFLFTVFKTIFIDSFYNYFIESYGVLGWYKVNPYFFTAFSYLILIGIIASGEFKKFKKDNLQSGKGIFFLINFGIFFITSLIIFFINYLTFTSKNKIGGDIIIGIQGRYFTPILPFLFFSLPALGSLIRKKYFLWLLILLSLIISTLLIYKKYY